MRSFPNVRINVDSRRFLIRKNSKKDRVSKLEEKGVFLGNKGVEVFSFRKNQFGSMFAFTTTDGSPGTSDNPINTRFRGKFSRRSSSTSLILRTTKTIYRRSSRTPCSSVILTPVDHVSHPVYPSDFPISHSLLSTPASTVCFPQKCT